MESEKPVSNVTRSLDVTRAASGLAGRPADGTAGRRTDDGAADGGAKSDAVQTNAQQESRATRDSLAETFDSLTKQPTVGWTMDYEMIRPIGQGGQGIVYLVDRYGAYNTRFRLALKFFNPAAYRSTEDYHADMARLARVAVRLTKLQHDNLLDVHNVVGTQGIDVQTMEWVDGADLRRLVGINALESIRPHVSPDRWDYLNDVVATPAGSQLRFKPGIAVSIVRRCLTGLGALHRSDIVHGDVKPANIMIKRTGSLKLIDMGSAFTLDEPPQRQAWTPRYAAVEVLRKESPTALSDLASLGYVLVEMLTGELPFAEARDQQDLIRMKMQLPDQLKSVLPPDGDASLRQFVRRLIDPEPSNRFQTADEAEMSDEGAVAFLRQLVKGDLDSEYENELREWLGEVLAV